MYTRADSKKQTNKQQTEKKLTQYTRAESEKQTKKLLYRYSELQVKDSSLLDLLVLTDPNIRIKLELGLQSHFHNPLAFQVKQGTCLGLNLHLDTNLSSSYELPLPLPTCCLGSETPLVKVALPQVVRLTSVEHASTVTTLTHTHTPLPHVWKISPFLLVFFFRGFPNQELAG